MGFGLIVKLLFFSVWPVLLLLIYYFFNREEFYRRLKMLKEKGLD